MGSFQDNLDDKGASSLRLPKQKDNQNMETEEPAKDDPPIKESPGEDLRKLKAV